MLLWHLGAQGCLVTEYYQITQTHKAKHCDNTGQNTGQNSISFFWIFEVLMLPALMIISIGISIGCLHILYLIKTTTLIEQRYLNILSMAIFSLAIIMILPAFYAFGMSPEEIRNIARNLRWLKARNITFSKLGLLDNSSQNSKLQLFFWDSLWFPWNMDFQFFFNNS